MFQRRLYQCPVLPPPCGFYSRFLTTMKCWETLEKHSFPWLQTQRLWILLHTRKAKQYSFKMTTKTVSPSDGIRNARPCLPWMGFLQANTYLGKTWGKKMLEIDNKKNVLQTCCGLCICVLYWTSDSLFPWTSVRLAGFDCIHLITILSLDVQNWSQTLKHFIYNVCQIQFCFALTATFCQLVC